MVKKIIKRAVAAVMTMTLMFSITACSGESVAKMMEDASKKMDDVKSMTYDMNMDIEMSSMGQNIAMKTTANAECLNNPLLMKMDLKMDMGAAGSMSSKMYMEQKDDKYTIYTGIDADGSTTWQKQEVNDVKQMEQYNAKASFDLYLKSAESFKENGTDKINGKDATRYDGVISDDNLSEVINSSGMLSQLSSLGISSDNISDMIKDSGDLNISIWLDDDKMPVKYEMDMTKMMQGIMKNALKGQEGSADITVGKTLITMTITGTNNVEKFEIPQDVKDSAK